MSNRVLVIGLDGMPRTLLRRLADQGVTPRLGELLARGSCAELVAPLPEVSSTSWATFLTGANPGSHGVYGFVDLLPGSYDTYFPNRTNLRAAPMWEHAERQGLTSLFLNVPGTYPAARIHGVMVSGFVAPTLERSVQPARLIEPLRQARYELDVEVGDAMADPAGFIQRVRRALTARTRVFRRLLLSEPWDLAVAVLTETDRLQHVLWRDVSDPSSPLHGAVMDFYRLVDHCVGELLDSADDAGVFVVSDHGFGPAHREFNVNAWLREQGWLASLEDTPSLRALNAASQVFALDPARFYLNRGDRFPGGHLDDRAAEELTREIADALLALRWRSADGRVGPGIDGSPVVAEVHRAADCYRGPLAHLAPDLVAVPAPGIAFRGTWNAREVSAPGVLTGTHTRGDAVLYSSRGLTADRADMADVAPAILAALGAGSHLLSGEIK